MSEKERQLGNWKKWFAPHILDRGHLYYIEDRVSDIYEENGEIRAIVQGTEPYEVFIYFDDSGIEDMDCDCPYAEDGNYCKHEAAVLYCLNERDRNSGSEVTLQTVTPEMGYQADEELQAVIEQIPEQEVKSFLYELAINNPALKSQIIAKYMKSVDLEQLKYFEEVITDIQNTYSDRYGFVDWRNASGYIQALVEFLYDNVDPLIEREELELAFETICLVFITIGATDIDDDGDIAYGVDCCYELWKRIVEKASDEQQKKMYQWFETNSSNDAIVDYMREYLETFRWNEFNSRYFLLKRLIHIDSEIQIQEEINRQGQKRSLRTSWISGIVLRRIDTMKELEFSKQEIQKYYDRFSYLPEILIKYTEILLEQNDYEKAVKLLKDAKEKEINENVVSVFSRQLIRIYQKTNNQKELLNELEFQITMCIQDNQLYIRELKRLLPDNEWNAWRQRIPGMESCKGIRMEFLREEKMYPELMDEIRKSSGRIHLLDLYEKELCPMYADEIRDLYAQNVIKSAPFTSNRKEYYQLVQNLKKVIRYPGGKEVAQSIADQWKKDYSRRPAFMDELRKAGF